MNAFTKFSLATAVGAASLSTVVADNPSGGGKPVAEIVKSLENSGYDPITGISFDDGAWEVDASKGGASVELTVDPKTGEVLREYPDDVDPRPPKGSLPLSEALGVLQKAGYVDIHEASFERRFWEIEVVRDGVELELHVDPTSGKVVAERAD